MVGLAAELTDVIETYHAIGRPVWLLVPTSGYQTFLAGGLPAESAFALTWGAACAGGRRLPSDGRRVLREHLLIGTWPIDAAVTEQAHRELHAANHSDAASATAP